LVAYAVPEPGAAPEADGIIAMLRRQLPRNMVPAHVIVRSDLPQTPSGKLDRRALPAPAAKPRPSNAIPADGAVAAICAVCSEILQVSAGPDDNFFALGGHSLLLTRLVARLRDELGVEIPVRRMFEVETLAEFCEGLTLNGELPSAIPRQ